MGDRSARTCAQCGDLLPADSPPDRKYCSRKCKSKFAYAKARGPLPDKNCLQCGVLMPEAPLARKFCSNRCKQRHLQDGKRVARSTPVCQHCGIEMPGAAVNRKYCSERCKTQHYLAQDIANRPKPVCLGCGTEMPVPTKPGEHRKYCSTACRERHYSIKYQDKKKVRNKSYREKNAETLKAKKREYRQENLEAHKAWDRARYLRKREEILAQAKAYYENNREQARARVAAYVEKKRQDPHWMAKERERGRQKWHKATEEQREAWRRRGQRRQSRKNMQRVGTVSASDWDAILRIWNHSCAYCGKPLEYNEHGNLIVDIEHIIPISRGGPHSIGNLVPSCEGCNHRKSWKLLVEWRYTPSGMKRLAKGPLSATYRKLPLP